MENMTGGDWALTYVLVSGVLFWPIIRPPFMRWYQSQTWILSGANPIEILFKQLGFWLMFEGFVFALSCTIGVVGGNLIAILRMVSWMRRNKIRAGVE
jgi:hypothetical protein